MYIMHVKMYVSQANHCCIMYDILIRELEIGKDVKEGHHGVI
jgi:hypothetical protein